MRRSGLERIGDHLGLVSKDIYMLLSIKNNWREIAGDVFAAHTVPVKLKGSRLNVMCDSPMWVQQVGLLELTLIENIRKITKVRIKEMDSKIGMLKKDIQAPADAPKPFRINIDRRAYENIENPELRKKIQSLAGGKE